MSETRRGRRRPTESKLPQLPFAQPRLNMDPVRLVSDDQLEAIHLMSLRVLEEIG